MRIWDLPAGYLNRQSLLGEHRELHGIHSILTNRKSGYARHPETMRWARARSGLAVRHRQLAAEMRLRGYVDRTPVKAILSTAKWPAVFVTDPGEQVALLRHKYAGKDQGRIPLPRSPQELWAQHKYSVLARSPGTYAALGRTVARPGQRILLAALATDLIWILRDAPSHGRLLNAVEHMWGHVRRYASPGDLAASRAGVGHMLLCTQKLAIQVRDTYLLSSTALSELAVFLHGDPAFN